MEENTGLSLESRIIDESRNALEEILRTGAREMLQATIEAEVADYIERHKHLVDEQTGRRLVVRNGKMPKQMIQTGLGDIEVKKHRVNDKREGIRFTSYILPPYMRRVPSIEALLSVLYLKGISTNAFPEAMKAILGENAGGLSPGTIVRLKSLWEEEYKAWAERGLAGKRYVYFWVDGIYFNVRLTDDRPCFLVIMGTLEDGTKELVAIGDGERESKLSWKEVLRDLKRRGLKEAPKLSVGDGALGFWAALEEEFPPCREQRCWVHSVPGRAHSKGVRCPPSGKTFEPDSLRQIVAA